MAISRIGVWSAQGSSTSVSVAIAATQYYDILIAFVATINTAPNTPAGWTLLGTTTNPFLYVFWRSAGDNETSFSTTISASTKWSVVVVNYRVANAPAGFLSTAGGSSASLGSPDSPAVAAGTYTLAAVDVSTSMTSVSISGTGWTKLVDVLPGTGVNLTVAENTSTDPPVCTFTFNTTALSSRAVTCYSTAAAVRGFPMWGEV